MRKEVVPHDAHKVLAVGGKEPPFLMGGEWGGCHALGDVEEARYSIYWHFWYQSTTTDAKGAAIYIYIYIYI